MKVPPERRGNCTPPRVPATLGGLNESPYEKAEKYGFPCGDESACGASMKVPTKKQRNSKRCRRASTASSLNESLSKKEGKCLQTSTQSCASAAASMKALPKRKGNVAVEADWTPVIKPQ